MPNYTSYYLYQKYEKRGNQGWLPSYPNVYSKDGDGTMPLVVKQTDDPQCGYIPPVDPIYRWINLDPSTDYICADCNTKASGTYNSGQTFSIECNNNPVLTSGETSGLTNLEYIRIGGCVTEIGQNALSGKTSLSGVTIPPSVTTIGNNAFRGDMALVDCAIPQSVTSIGEGAFRDCIGLQNIILWDTITSIGASAFTNCDYLVSVHIPSGISTIPDSCFRDCGAIIDLSTNAYNINDYAFANCTSLMNVTLPRCTQINTYSFANCTNLRSITLDNLAVISVGAFSGCTKLDSVVIGERCRTINNDAFRGCNNLTSISCLSTTPPWLGTKVFDSTNNCPIYVPAESVEAYKSATNWSNYASRIMVYHPYYRWYPSGTTCIGYDKWQNSIHQYSDDNVNWINVTPIETSATTLIEANSRDCGYNPDMKFSAVYMDSTTYRLGCNGDSTLSGSEVKGHTTPYSAMTSAVIGDCVAKIADKTFEEFLRLQSIEITDSVTTIGKWAFKGCSALTSVDIPSGVTTIKELTFAQCYSLSSVTIPDSVTTIGSSVFSECTSLSSVTIPNTITSIGSGAFQSCGLRSVDIPSSITSIESSVFSSCSHLSSVTIPRNITSIGDYAFAGCSSLSSITCLNTTPPTLGGQDVFYRTNNCPIYVPSGSVSSYRSATNWSLLASRIQAIPS